MAERLHINAFSFRVLKQSDFLWIEGFRRLLKETGLELASLECEAPGIGDIKTKSFDELGWISELQSDLLQRLTVQISGGIKFTLYREENHHFDKFSSEVIQDFTPGREKWLQVYAKLRSTLGARSDKDFAEERIKSIGEIVETRSVEFAQLKSLVTEITVKTANRQRELEKAFDAKREALEREYLGRRQELEKEHEAAVAGLKEREEEFELAKKTLDDRHNRHARRDIHKTVKEEIARRYTEFQVTKGTQRKRWPIIAAVVVLELAIGLSAAFYSYTLSQVTPAATSEYFLLLFKQTILLVAFASVIFYFIRWQNTWFYLHAKEEFRLKRFDLDFDRASWIVEMAFEWKDEKGSEIPPTIVESLTRALFVDEDAGKTEESTFDQFASALLGNSARLKLKLADQEMEIERQGLKRLKKESKQES